MLHMGSCHCEKISFEVEGDFTEGMACNCSMCRRRGSLLAFVPAENFELKSLRADLSTYTFNKHVLFHHFCSTCGIAPFSEGKKPDGSATVAINLRCIPDVDPDAIKVTHWDGAHH